MSKRSYTRKPGRPEYTDWSEQPEPDAMLYTVVPGQQQHGPPPVYRGVPNEWGPRDDYIKLAMALRYAYAGRAGTAALCAYAIRNVPIRERLVQALTQRGLL